MEIVAVISIVLKVIGLFVLIAIFVKVNHVIKNQVSIMASLKEFQDQAARIDTATQNIQAHVLNEGMSATDQDAALTVVREAVDKLTSAIPVSPSATP